MTEDSKFQNLAKSFSITEAAWLWCSRDPSEYQALVESYESDTTLTLSQFPDVEARATLIYDAIVKGELPLRNSLGGHEDSFGDLATAGKEACCLGLDIKNWLTNNFPKERPTFLFEENSLGKPTASTPKKRESNTGDLNIIGALLALISGTLPDSGGEKHPLWNSESSLILQLQAAYDNDLIGLSESNLKAKFSAAKKSVQKKR